MARRGQKSLLYSMLFSNWRNKGTALLLALVIWGMTFGSSLHEKTMVVEVTIGTPEQDQVVTDMYVLEERKGRAPTGRVDFNGRVKLTLSGQRHALDDLEGRYRGEFQPQPNGEVELLDTRSYQLPDGIEVTAAEPYRIKVVVERYVTESLPVRVISNGEPPEGLSYDNTKVTTDPPTVSVRMPESYKGKVEVFTDPLELNRLRLNESNFVELGLANPSVPEELNASLVRLEGVGFSVKVYPNLQDARKEKEFEIPVEFQIESGRQVRITETEQSVRVVVKATPDRLSQLEQSLAAGKCELVIIASTEPGTHTYSVNLRGFGDQSFHTAGWPADVQVVRWDPPLLSYEITNTVE